MKKRKMAAMQPQTGKSKGSRQHIRDVDSKIMFRNPVLCSQFLRDNVDIPVLKNVRPEDIEDETERYQAFLGTEFEADTVKKIRIHNGEKEQQIYMISLIEHKSRVDYDIAMQLLRYMQCIWTEYGKEMERKAEGITKQKSFRYPPILPIVYYEGEERWTADLHLKDRILMNEIFSSYLPDFTYKLVRIHDLTDAELMGREDEMSLLMMINKIQTPEELERLLETEQSGIARIVKDTSEPVLEIIASVIWALCMKMNLPQEEAKQCVEKVKERRMGYLFENAKLPDIQAVRREAQKLEREIEEAQRKLEKLQREEEKARKEVEKR
ncbi:MAG: Rpn family recombination-promoting nuclease/putative transposase [Eubacteriales bacterium]|nr:Rpn family recombination-promoting nuclease/putative transposase [Eubacteriales bacterium]